MDLMESNGMAGVMTAFTLYALYADDFRVLFTEIDADPAFDWLSGTAFFLFALELFIFAFFKDGYFSLPSLDFSQDLEQHHDDGLAYRLWRALAFASFYFWLDLVATSTMIFDIQAFDVLGTNEADVSAESQGGDNNLDAARASKASKAGARAGRVVRIIRMIRLLRLVKLFKYFSGDKKKDKDGKHVVPEEDDDVENLPPESHVGAAMSDLTTKRVIVMILGMLVAIPMLGVDTTLIYAGMKTPENFFVASFYDVYSADNAKDDSVADIKDFIFQDETMNCIGMSIGVCNANSCDNFEVNDMLSDSSFVGINSYNDIITSLRPNEFDQISEGDLTFYFYKRDENQDSALLGILLTTFVIILLGGGTMQFSSEVNRLVLIPIEKMVQLVREISENPLKKEFTSISQSDIDNNEDGMETTLLLQTITKIAGLMRVGFGEAGAEIISKNLANGDHSKMNLLGYAEKIESIFGFCDIRNFTDTTECLQEEVMLFVNRIAHILHGIVVQCDGSANKNIGDAFLLTWKLDEAKMGNGGDQEFVGDKALLSLLKTTAEMARHEDFICNFSTSALAMLFERMPGYKCKMGCGLHKGWAVEGAIGSDKKIDASYISPHVNWAEFLESSTKEYGVPVLMSEPFFKLLSPHVKKWCRQVDNIKKSESDEVTGLYTYDVNPDVDFTIPKNDPVASDVIYDKRKLSARGNMHGHRHGHGGRKTMKRTSMDHNGARASMLKRNSHRSPTFDERSPSARGERTLPKIGEETSPDLSSTNPRPRPSIAAIDQKHHDPTSMGDAPEIILEPYSVATWESDEDLIIMRTHMDDNIRSTFATGMKLFIDGDWEGAMAKFSRTLEITNGRDGPSKNIMNHIVHDYGGTCPTDWKGYRDMS